MMGLPAWAREDPRIIGAGSEYLPIVCTGTKTVRHDVELIGIYFRDESSSWATLPRVERTPDGLGITGQFIVYTVVETKSVVTEDGVRTTSTRDRFGNWTVVTEAADPQERGAGSWNGDQGGVVIDCPACAAVHRTSRAGWETFLETQRVSCSPWADVSGLD